MFGRVAGAIFFAIAGTALGGDFESVLKADDVVALVGGEDMVAMSGQGDLELLLLRAMPEKRLKFRGLAWEGDTVFEQRRELNYPALEQQLTTHRVTVVLAQFGTMESLRGEERLPEFIAAYEKLIDRLSNHGKRRMVLIGPTPQTAKGTLAEKGIATHLPPVSRSSLESYTIAIRDLAQRRGLVFRKIDVAADGLRDGLHLNPTGQRTAAFSIALSGKGAEGGAIAMSDAWAQLDRLIETKNELWFHYYRPQNWAFLAGDRTSQPSSRDHRDLNKRWFPEELEQFLALIEAKEREIWALAERLQKQ